MDKELTKMDKEELTKKFIESHKQEFNIFLKDVYIDKNRDIDYWIKVFCEEEMKEEFKEYEKSF